MLSMSILIGCTPKTQKLLDQTQAQNMISPSSEPSSSSISQSKPPLQSLTAPLFLPSVACQSPQSDASTPASGSSAQVGTEKWSFQTENFIRTSSPAIGADGTIYIGIRESGNANSSLYAIDPNGTQKWAFPVNSQIDNSSPAIGADGTIYIGSLLDKRLYAIYSSSHGLANSPWPKFHKNNMNTGLY